MQFFPIEEKIDDELGVLALFEEQHSLNNCFTPQAQLWGNH